MTITNISEINNKENGIIKPIREKQDIFLKGIINKNIPCRNGFVYLISGAAGSGKSSMMLNLFKSKSCYRGIFNNLYYFTPESSFLSVVNHPFKNHHRVYHNLDVSALNEIYNELNNKKIDATKPKEKKNKKQVYENEIISDSSDEEKEIEYSCIIIDDFANVLKDNDISQFLSKFIIKSRHLCCAFIITIQSYLYYPKILRKQLTNATIYKPKNVEEFISVSKELFNMNKDDALTLFNYCFSEVYSHLDIDTTLNKYYKNWNLLNIEFKK